MLLTPGRSHATTDSREDSTGEGSSPESSESTGAAEDEQAPTSNQGPASARQRGNEHGVVNGRLLTAVAGTRKTVSLAYLRST